MRRTWLAAVVAASVLLAGCSSFGGTSAAPASGSAQTSGPARASAPGAAASPTPQKPGNYVLIMDASGSMRKTDVGAGTRMTAAQAAASTFVGSLPKGSRVGLVTYGDKTLEEAPKSAGCTDVTTAVPLGADMAGVTAAAKALKPVGWTPIGKALQTAAAQAKGRPLNVVLITDGEDTCAPPDPCDTAASLVGSDVGLTISAIGLKTSSDQLTCVATKGKGYFVTASNSNQLARRLEALRDPAAAARTLSPSGVRSITPGQLADDIRKAHPDFPAVSSGTQVRVVWGGCTWVFSAKGVLLSIELGDAGSTIDGLAVGDAASADQVRKAAGEPESTRIGKVDCVADGTWAITAGTFGPMKNAGWLILQKTGPSWTLASRITSTPGCSRISADAPLAELRAYMPGMCDLAWGPAIIKQAPITMNGIGDLRLGADGSDLEQRGLATATDGQCDANYITVTRLDGSVAGDFRGSRLTGLWVRDTAMKTTAGAHVGMSVSEVQRLYAGKLRSSTHQGDMSAIKTLVYTYGGRILEFSYSDSGTGADTSSVNGIYVSFSDIPFKHGC